MAGDYGEIIELLSHNECADLVESFDSGKLAEALAAATQMVCFPGLAWP